LFSFCILTTITLVQQQRIIIDIVSNNNNNNNNNNNSNNNATIITPTITDADATVYSYPSYSDSNDVERLTHPAISPAMMMPIAHGSGIPTQHHPGYQSNRYRIQLQHHPRYPLHRSGTNALEPTPLGISTGRIQNALESTPLTLGISTDRIRNALVPTS
jgi:hypothetical protein